MTFQWTIAVSFLYTEVFIVFLLLLPLPPSLWKRFFDLKLIRILGAYAHVYFHMVLSIFVLLFADSIRELRKYANIELSEIAMPQAGHHIYMRQFRAQRNFYIAGGALFLCFVINRLISLTLRIAQAIANADASKRQAMSASRTASSLLSEKSANPKNEESSDITALSKELEQTNLEYVRLKTRFDALTKDYKFLQDENRKQEILINEAKSVKGENAKDK